MSVVSEIGSQLQSAGVGTVGTNLFEGLLPESPAEAVAVLEHTGLTPIRTSGRVAVERPSVEILVRHTDYESGYTKAKAVRTALQNFTGTILGVRYLEVTMAGSIYVLGTDELRRFLFALHFKIMKEPS